MLVSEFSYRASPMPSLRVGLTALTLACVGLACSARDRRTPADTLVVVVDGVMRTADPRFASTNHDQRLTKLVAPGLTSLDTPSLEPKLELAASIEQVAPLAWEVGLRDARFSDGTPVTADDVAWTFDSVLRAGSTSLFAKSLRERFRAISVVTPQRVRFDLQKPLATLLTDLDFGILSRRHGEAGHIVGAGPYRLRSLDGSAAWLDANPYYFDGVPHVAKLQIKFVTDPAARVLMLAGGSADLVQNGVRLDMVDDVLLRERLRLATGPSLLLTYLLLNNTDARLRDVRVRQALALAIDYDALIAGKFGGRAVRASGLLPPSHWAYGGPAPVRYDPAAAKALLDAAGWPDPDGDGPAPRFALTYKTSSDAFRVSVARVIAAQLGQIGVAVEVLPFEFGTVFADIKKGTYQLASMQTADITELDFFYAYFHSSRVPTPASPDGGNRWHYKNLELDALLDQGRAISERAARRALYRDAQTILARDMPIVPLWHEAHVVVHNRTVTGYTILPNGRYSNLRFVTKTR